MANRSSNPTVSGCTFSGNSGGGMANDNSSPVVIDCTFTSNLAEYGGGMFNVDSSSPTVTDCTFSGNSAALGGGMCNHYSDPTVTNCTFSGNSAGGGGGGMLNVSSSPMLTNCTIDGNTATNNGGGMLNIGSGRPTLTNCTFSGNSATNGNALAFLGGPSDVMLTSCILWDGGEGIWNNDGSTVTINYTNVEGGFPGTGNIDADPMFVDPDNGDYRLSPGSPCIDAGHNWAIVALANTDLAGNPRFADDPATDDTGCGVPVVVDMGAYEYQGEPFPVKLGDIDGDGAVGVTDILLVLESWGACVEDCCLADFNLDGEVGVNDFLILLAYWK
jgi:parallel beta-helix repeat protein